ncbi:MAG: class I SAM-dependent methyltransferase [Prosthecobacter sp.]|nr:class I SAM-dependent methyltransferase [Prosthecobacter sp.]
MATEERDWYDTPLYYDIIFDADTAREGAFLEAVQARHGRTRGRQMLEPACGSGRLVAEMARRGWKVSGFDGSERMLDFARERLQQQGLKARLWHDWLQSFTVPGKVQPSFDLAHCLVSTFKYLLTEADAVAHLRRVAACLKSGGLYALGIHLSDYGRALPEHERWVGERDGVHVVCNTRSWPADRATRLEAMRNRLKITRGSATHTQETRWQFRTYNAAQVRALIRKAPELTLLACYDFTYDIEASRELDDSYSDVILVLRRQ